MDDQCKNKHHSFIVEKGIRNHSSAVRAKDFNFFVYSKMGSTDESIDTCQFHSLFKSKRKGKISLRLIRQHREKKSSY